MSWEWRCPRARVRYSKGRGRDNELLQRETTAYLTHSYLFHFHGDVREHGDTHSRALTRRNANADIDTHACKHAQYFHPARGTKPHMLRYAHGRLICRSCSLWKVLACCPFIFCHFHFWYQRRRRKPKNIVRVPGEEK